MAGSLDGNSTLDADLTDALREQSDILLLGGRGIYITRIARRSSTNGVWCGEDPVPHAPKGVSERLGSGSGASPWGSAVDREPSLGEGDSRLDVRMRELARKSVRMSIPRVPRTAAI